ncbi:matrix metalloproteinase-15-like [Cryptotermes secundus]|uniref:matrix metalloproteinase-15-like n=1 Tax=Cryptotermes secundus TaxID=105785 RepID=UPI001454DC80|nr:matrix metalloproteinase-15-like [Cryptotermes secundus]
MKAMLKVALADFQKFYGLPPTGKMDEATSKALQQPRCGEKDILSHKELHSRRKRYTHWGEPWTGHHYPQNTVLSQAAVDEETALAFAVWASVQTSFKEGRYQHFILQGAAWRWKAF